LGVPALLRELEAGEDDRDVGVVDAKEFPARLLTVLDRDAGLADFQDAGQESTAGSIGGALDRGRRQVNRDVPWGSLFCPSARKDYLVP
jgi:hypothetical protein